MKGRRIDNVFDGLRISGFSDDKSEREDSDSVHWQMEFSSQVKDGDSWIDTGFDHGMVSAGIPSFGRRSTMEKYGSAPSMSTSLNWVEVRVSNDERGWVAKGSFPKAPRIIDKDISDEGEMSKYVPIGVFTDIRRDAKAGFKVAREWAKFRTMAVESRDFLFGKLKDEYKGKVEHNERQLMRSRCETANSLMIQFLPNTLTSKKRNSLRDFYVPGVLEAEVALELEKGIYPKHGVSESSFPISYIRADPVEVSSIGKNGKYSAVFPFRMYSCSSLLDDEISSSIVQNVLDKNKYSNIRLGGKSIDAKIYVPDVGRVMSEILEGSDDTVLHREAYKVVDAVKEIYSFSNGWREYNSSLKSKLEKIERDEKVSHFSKLGEILSKGNS